MSSTLSAPHLFSPITLRELELRNRVFLAPMCMYSCERRDGMPGVFHMQHLVSRAYGGFGMVLTEATAVTPEGRISPQDTGLWSDAHARAWVPIVAACHEAGAAVCVQLAHAGRKASTYRGFPGEPTGVVPITDGGWETQDPGTLTPRHLEQIIDAFAAAAARADAAGFDAVEVHAAHGYLLHQFLSPLSNTRDDEYGGSQANRCRFTLEVIRTIRDVWPAHKPVLLRVSATDWIEGGWTPQDTVYLAQEAARAGVDLVDASSGGIAPANIPVGPGYQVGLAEQIRRQARVPTGAVGLLTKPQQAADVLAKEQADVVLLGRAALREPSWPLRAAHELGLDAASLYPAPYLRGAPVDRK